ncbi:exodeoxyribonuclease V subunit beta [Thalassotalea sp. 1_MG-2023]|uniref:exodeoxyribonuclease V subunit beta n=1 Tax=Thalassotalea sp. 1_MG-2023 TaxID=3062680 RepID=UPI0026E392C5|nr:exodeoxyribonuclease V subunit beta [Thalassotalea sp. 1_MG-2023]MDO6428475.1 exodeoxyribonuclease V subunit beta [Thalassotalea sp. 1_MG-2023]
MSSIEFLPLMVANMPLKGRHLIEASAGTGKTFNITRIYLRLLLERKLTVQQILVMTFTKDATEEIRGRIDQFLRTTLNDWDALILTDDFFTEIANITPSNEVKALLKRALLFLDEAAIYTIHGFCKTVLSQHAFATGTAFNANLEAQQHDIITLAIEDWYRTLSIQEPDTFALVSEFWLTPQTFSQQFSRLIGYREPIEVKEPNDEIAQFCQLAMQAHNDLIKAQPFLFEQLIDGKPVKEQESRKVEFTQLLDWLKACSDNYEHSQETMPTSFFNGRRFGRSKVKEQLVEIFSTVNLIKKRKDSLLSDIRKLYALKAITSGLATINENVVEQKKQQKILSFDDLIQSLADTLSESSAQPLIRTLTEQYPFALVDEFQDTDQDQYRILNALYQDQENTGLVMIGDPKQAIYGFRGGDIFTYMAARKAATYRWRMNTNWRSSKEMITGYNRLFYGNALSGEAKPVFGFGIDYNLVEASPNPRSNLLNCEKALSFIHFPAENDKPVTQPFRQLMATWCANKIISLLKEQPKLRAQDVALLVRDGAEAQEIKQALKQAGLSSVYLSDRTNLWHSEETQHLIPLLKGILTPESDRYFCSAMANPLLSIAPSEYYNIRNDDLQWQQYKQLFIDLKTIWVSQGFVTMALKLMHTLIAIQGQESERSLTNLLHLFELLQAKSQQLRQPDELLHWLEQQYQQELPDQETELRLESEENLIKIVTQHGAKGLEYPVVFIPFSTRAKNPLRFGTKNIQAIAYHDDNERARVTLSADEQALTAMANEAYAESIRLLYVAVTRAEQHCFVLTTPFDKYHLSPLGKTLMLSANDDLLSAISQLADDQPNEITITVVDDISVEYYQQKQPDVANAEVAKFQGNIERDWWLTSFTALNRNLRDVGVSQPERNDDPLNSQSELSNQILNVDHQGQLRFALTKGAAAGNLLHDILEHASFDDPHWAVDCQWPLSKYGALPDGFEQTHLYEWLDDIVDTTLIEPQVVENLSLSSLDNARCLKEVEFYFPLEKVSTKALTSFLLNHRKQQCQMHLMPEVQRQLYLPAFKTLKGMMHGFIDLVFEHQGKYYVCDYKSTHLGHNFSDYLPSALLGDIQRHHYDLQYLIYAVALHRYLKQQLPNYHPDQHFGGILYLYLRGIHPDQANSGVFYTPISSLLLTQLDSLFDSQFVELGVTR